MPSTAGPSAARAGTGIISRAANAHLLEYRIAPPPESRGIVASGSPANPRSGTQSGIRGPRACARAVQSGRAPKWEDFGMTEGADHEAVSPIHSSPGDHPRRDRLRGRAAGRPLHAAV